MVVAAVVVVVAVAAVEAEPDCELAVVLGS